MTKRVGVRSLYTQILCTHFDIYMNSTEINFENLFMRLCTQRYAFKMGKIIKRLGASVNKLANDVHFMDIAQVRETLQKHFLA